MNNIIVLQVFCKYLLCKLRPIVTCNGIWQTMSREDLFQTFDDFLCCCCSSYLNLIISAIIVNHNKNVLSGWQWTHVIDCQILSRTIRQLCPRHRFRFQWHPHQLASMTSATLSFTVLVYSRPPYFAAQCLGDLHEPILVYDFAESLASQFLFLVTEFSL